VRAPEELCMARRHHSFGRERGGHITVLQRVAEIR
jgi:hypothetical protein